MSRVIPRRLILSVFLLVWTMGLVAPSLAMAQAAAPATPAPPTSPTPQPPPPPAPPPPPDYVYAAKLDEVWDATVNFFKTRPLPIAIASAEKEKGVIKTVPHRYFKIASATFPPRQQDFRDTYTLTFTALPKGPPPKNPSIPGVAPLPPDKAVDLTKLQVERKFEKYDKKAKAWADADPSQEHAGISAQDIFRGVQLQLTPPPPPSALDE